MTVEQDIAEIKDIIKSKKELLNDDKAYIAKVQGMNIHDKYPKYFVYITKLIKRLGIQKGDKIAIQIKLVSRNPEIAATAEDNNQINIVQEAENLITEEEQDFLDRYKREEKESIKVFLLNNAKKTFGEQRVEELLK